MDRKDIRRITGYTFVGQRSNKESWYGLAVSFHDGAIVLGQHQDSISGGKWVFFANAALSIELLLKAILIARGKAAPRTHELSNLASMAGVAFTENQGATLELLTAMLKWSGRYPIPNREANWDDYHDRILKKHIITEQDGNITRVRANPETFPSIDAYEALWDIANRRWNEI